MRRLTLASALAVAVALAIMAAAVARAADEKKEEDDKAVKVKEADVPAAVMATVKKHFPKARIERIEKETEDGKVLYDFEMRDGGTKWEADIQDDGTLIETEKEIKAKDAPEAVTKAIEEKYPKAKIHEVMAKMKGEDKTVHEYEVVMKDGGKEKEVTVSPDGKITEEAADEPDEKGKEKEKD
jgi:hypothetical protein